FASTSPPEGEVGGWRAIRQEPPQTGSIQFDVRRAFADHLAIGGGEGDVDAGDLVAGFDGLLYVMLLDLHGADFRSGEDGNGDVEGAIDQVADFGRLYGFAGAAVIFEIDQDLKGIDALGVEIAQLLRPVLSQSGRGKAQKG